MGLFKQWQQPAAALQIQFPHDVINEQHRRRAMQGGDIFRLRHLEGDSQRSFLAFAGVKSRWTLVERQLQLVAMRSDDRRAISAFALTRLSQLYLEVGFHAGQVIESKKLGSTSYRGVSGLGERQELREQLAPAAHDVFAGGNQ